MITAERQIDACLYRYDADGTLTIIQRGEDELILPPHIVYGLLAFVRLEGIAQQAARREHARQRRAWEAA